MNDRVKILLLTVFYTPVVLIIFALIVFVPAGLDFKWLEGWLFVLSFVLYVIFYLLYALIFDPEMLMKRAKYTTDDPDHKAFSDKTFLVGAAILLLFIVIIPGLEHAAGNPPLPWFVELLGLLGIIIGLVGMTYVNFVNVYASKGLVIHKDHKLVTNGPYQYVRHPLYAIITLFVSGLPLLLGSFTAFIISLLFPFVMISRIRIEEKMLIEFLPGYKEYMQQVPYRLIPKVY